MEDQLISEKDQVDQAIADYFEEVYEGDGHQVDTDADIVMWTRLEAAAEMTQGMFSMLDVEEAMRASNFNKALMASTAPSSSQGTRRTDSQWRSQPRSLAS